MVFQFNQGSFTLRGCLANTFLVIKRGGVHLTSRESRTVMLHRTLPRTKNHQIHNVNSTEVQKPCVTEYLL